MSRVDDDREAARVAAKQMEAKRAEESRKSGKAAENSAFARMVAKSKGEAQKAQTQQAEQQGTARDVLAALLERTESPAGELANQKQFTTMKEERESFKGRLGSKETEGRVKEEHRSEGQKVEQAHVQTDQGAAQQLSSHTAEQAGAAHSGEAHEADAKKSSETQGERSEASDKASAGRGAQAAKGKGDLKSDADKGGGSQSGNKDSKGGGGAPMNPGFRFNPALMAPMQVAKQKDVGGSERLRKVANELAQKIVENVRVGTNAMGRSEFQIDLRSNVLSGVSVKISSHQGKIKAMFTGSDKDVLKLIEEHGEELKKALAARGLTLEDFKIETRA